MMRYEFEIPVYNFDNFEKEAKRLSKKAAKLDVPFDFEVSEEVVTYNIPHRLTRPDGSTKDVKVPTDFRKVSIVGDEEFSINGWEVIAKAEFLEGGAVISSIRDNLSKEHGDMDRSCDHCGYKRRRKRVFLLENENTGEHMQVGSTCLNDFLGHPSALDLAEFYARLKSLRELEKPTVGGYWILGDADAIELEKYLAYVDSAIESNGWLSRSKAYHSREESTADLSLHAYRQGCFRLDQDRTVTPVPSKEVKDAIEWAAGIEDPDNDYLHNISVIANSEYIKPSHIGYAASILPAYRRHVANAAARNTDSDWIGEEGERVEREVVLKDVKEFPDSWNPGCIRRMYKMVDADQNILVWWTGSAKLANKKGERFVMRGTVKKHGDFKGTKQTTVNRVHIF